jgi:hypothetical protein
VHPICKKRKFKLKGVSMYLIFVSTCLPKQFGEVGMFLPTPNCISICLKKYFKRGRQESTRFACISNLKRFGICLALPSTSPCFKKNLKGNRHIPTPLSTCIPIPLKKIERGTYTLSSYMSMHS